MCFVGTPTLSAPHSALCPTRCHLTVLWLSTVCRSYGRAPKMIHLESNFVQFKEELLPKEGNKALLTFPFLHIYWTECCVSTDLQRRGWACRVCGFARQVWSSPQPVALPLVLLFLSVQYWREPCMQLES